MEYSYSVFTEDPTNTWADPWEEPPTPCGGFLDGDGGYVDYASATDAQTLADEVLKAALAEAGGPVFVLVWKTLDEGARTVASASTEGKGGNVNKQAVD